MRPAHSSSAPITSPPTASPSSFVVTEGDERHAEQDRVGAVTPTGSATAPPGCRSSTRSRCRPSPPPSTCRWAAAPSASCSRPARSSASAPTSTASSATGRRRSSSPFADKQAWLDAVAKSDVRLQWDPDHGPWGQKLERRALQLGLRRAALASYARDWIVEIEDVSAFVAEQRRHVFARELDRLHTPRERVYPVGDAATAALLQLDHGRS